MALSERDRAVLADGDFWRRYLAQWGWKRGVGEAVRSNGWRKLADLRLRKSATDEDRGG